MSGVKMAEEKKYLKVQELAAMLEIPAATVYGWRLNGLGPRRLKIGGTVRFAVEDVEKWLAEQENS